MDNMGLNTATTVNVFNDYTEYVLSDVASRPAISSTCCGKVVKLPPGNGA